MTSSRALSALLAVFLSFGCARGGGDADGGATMDSATQLRIDSGGGGACAMACGAGTVCHNGSCVTACEPDSTCGGGRTCCSG
ncbi:MAG: hypothetical protein AB7S26_28385, partial [Sandaracinaceae bacterium]